MFNGDMGEIVSIFYAKENTEKEDMAVVSFDGNEILRAFVCCEERRAPLFWCEKDSAKGFHIL